MNQPPGGGEERARYVRRMFGRIAHRYDLMNRLMTGGQDLRWRREVIHRATLPPGGRLLDLGAGTGDLARLALRQNQDCRPVAADFTLEMMRFGKARRESLEWCAGDALQLPFPDETFHAVVSGFLLRNVYDVPACLNEQYRALKPGGRIVILDTTRPSRNWYWPLIYFHLNTVIPTLGEWVAGDRQAYTYLPDSTQSFLTAEQLEDAMKIAGFREIDFQRAMLGTIAIHWGSK